MALKDKYLTVSQAAKELGVTRQTIHRWVKKGEIPAEKVGRETLVEKKAVTDHSHQKDRESFYKLIDNYCIEDIRRKCGYSKEDKIEHIEPDKEYLVYLVSRKNGSREKVKVGGIEVTVTMGINQKVPEIKDIKFIDIVKTECRQPKGRKEKVK